MDLSWRGNKIGFNGGPGAGGMKERGAIGYEVWEGESAGRDGCNWGLRTVEQ